MDSEMIAMSLDDLCLAELKTYNLKFFIEFDSSSNTLFIHKIPFAQTKYAPHGSAKAWSAAGT